MRNDQESLNVRLARIEERVQYISQMLDKITYQLGVIQKGYQQARGMVVMVSGFVAVLVSWMPTFWK